MRKLEGANYGLNALSTDSDSEENSCLCFVDAIPPRLCLHILF